MDPSSPVAIAIWIVLMPFLYLLGSFAERWINDEDALLRGVLYVGLGFWFLACFVIFAGHLKVMKPITLILLAIFILIGRRKKIREFWQWFSSLFREILFRSQNQFARFLQVVFGISLLITFLACFLPEIAGDAVAHHLALPKRYLQMGQVAPVPHDFKSYQSILMNALYVIGLMFHSVPVAKLFHWWAGVMLTFALITFIRRKTRQDSIALFSGLMLWLTPTFMTQVSTTYVDIGVSFFMFLSFYLFWRALEHNRMTNFFFSGAFLGLAGNSKYSGLLGLAPLIAGFGYFILYSRFSFRSLKAILSFGCGFWILGGFLFIRNWMLKGNPLFPMFASFIGEKAYSDLTHALLYQLGPLGKNPFETILSFFLIPWNFTFVPQYATFSFSLTPAFKATLGEWMGPFYFLSLPFVLYGLFKKDSAARFCCFFVFFYILAWFFIGRYIRYLLPVFPIYLIAFAIGLKYFFSQCGNVQARYVAYSGCLMTLFLFSILVYHFRTQYKPLLGIWGYRTYLENMERTYPIADWVNHELALNAKILSIDEFRLFYFDREITREVMLYRFTRYADGKTPREIAEFLKSIGITHILATEPIPSKLPINQEGGPGRLDLLLFNDRLAKKLITMDSRNLREGRYRYSIYELLV